ncbi:MAG TPA: hypothetical protein VN043_01090 [Rhodanobacter sp.]|nr:hypothetical protein [Rhodanobacter sp.]
MKLIAGVSSAALRVVLAANIVIHPTMFVIIRKRCCSKTSWT